MLPAYAPARTVPSPSGCGLRCGWDLFAVLLSRDVPLPTRPQQIACRPSGSNCRASHARRDCSRPTQRSASSLRTLPDNAAGLRRRSPIPNAPRRAFRQFAERCETRAQLTETFYLSAAPVRERRVGLWLFRVSYTRRLTTRRL